MKNVLKPLTALLLALAIGATACGADEVSTSAGADPAQSPDTSQEDNTQEDRDLPASEQPNTDEENNEAAGGLQLIGTANIGGEIVSPQPQEIVELLIAESYPEQLHITFTGGDVNCLAATATAHISEDGTQVIVLLTSGITSDALTKSCLAGEFDHQLNIQLDVGLDGREVLTPGLPDEEPDSAAPAQPAFEETLIGLSEQSASEGAELFGYSVRVTERDGEAFAVTLDYRTDRINVVITDGVVTSASIG